MMPAGAAGGARRAGQSRIAVGFALALLAGCSSAPPPVARPAVDRALIPFLPDPSPLAAAAYRADTARLHAQLLASADPAQLLAAAEALVARAPGDPGLRLLVASCRLATGQAAAALAEIGLLAPAEARRPEVALVAGRAAEELDDPAAALSWYRLSPGEPAAARSRALEPLAVERLAGRIREQLARGRFEEAGRAPAEPEQLRPAALATVELARSVAAARGDSKRELAALRALAPAHTDALELQLRRAVLEVEVGDARVGLELLAALVARHPSRPDVATAYERGKLLFRLANAPDEVRLAAGRAQLTRAELARLIYWLLPDVRAVRGGSPRIASDILDHPARDEIVRVVNLGLLPVDEALHQFGPERPVRRGEALRAVLLEPSGGGWRACAGAAVPDVCTAALACGLLPEVGECLPGGTVAGRDAVDWIRLVSSAPGATR